MHVSGHTAIRYVAVWHANMHLIGERYFLYSYRVQCDRAFSPVTRVNDIYFDTKPGIRYLRTSFHFLTNT